MSRECGLNKGWERKKVTGNDASFRKIFEKFC